MSGIVLMADVEGYVVGDFAPDSGESVRFGTYRAAWKYQQEHGGVIQALGPKSVRDGLGGWVRV